MKKTYLISALIFGLIATTGLFAVKANQSVTVTLDTTSNTCTFGDYTISGLSVSLSAQPNQATNTPAFDCDMFDETTAVDTYLPSLAGSASDVIPSVGIELTVNESTSATSSTASANAYDNPGAVAVEFLAVAAPANVTGTSVLSIDIPAALPADSYSNTMTITY